MRKIQVLDYSNMGVKAIKFVSSHFECGELNKRILERKNKLCELGEK